MAGHWKVNDIKLEVMHLEKLLVARPNLANQKEVLVSGLKNKVANMGSLDSAALLELYNIFQSSKLPGDITMNFLTLLDKNALAGPCHAGATQVLAKPQALDALQKYLTLAEHNMLATADMWSGCSVLSKRMRLLGVRSLKESTKKVATAILLYYEWKRVGRLPGGDSSYVLSQHLLAAFQGCQVEVSPAVPLLAVYPDDPWMLDKAHLEASYGDDKPAGQDLPELAMLLKTTWVRNTSKQVKKAGGCTTSKLMFLIQSSILFVCLLFFNFQLAHVCIGKPTKCWRSQACRILWLRHAGEAFGSFVAEPLHAPTTGSWC